VDPAPLYVLPALCTMKKDFLNKFIRLKAIADTGLLYADNDYDRERYEELKNLSIELISDATGITPIE
jgi:hypothetical protein